MLAIDPFAKRRNAATFVDCGRHGVLPDHLGPTALFVRGSPRFARPVPGRRPAPACAVPVSPRSWLFKIFVGTRVKAAEGAVGSAAAGDQPRRRRQAAKKPSMPPWAPEMMRQGPQRCPRHQASFPEAADPFGHRFRKALERGTAFVRQPGDALAPLLRLQRAGAVDQPAAGPEHGGRGIEQPVLKRRQCGDVLAAA